MFYHDLWSDPDNFTGSGQFDRIRLQIRPNGSDPAPQHCRRERLTYPYLIRLMTLRRQRFQNKMPFLVYRMLLHVLTFTEINGSIN